MRHHIEPDGTLIVTADSRLVSGLLLGAAALCTVPVLRAWLTGSVTAHDATPLIGSAMFLLGALVSYEWNRFVFDPHHREVRWSRRSLWSQDEGRVPFSHIRSLILQLAIGSTKTAPSVRLTLITDEMEIPLSRAYAGGMKREYETLATMIRRVMQMSPEPANLLMDSVTTAVAQGRTLDAITLVRLAKGGTLEEAKQYVERLAVPPSVN